MKRIILNIAVILILVAVSCYLVGNAQGFCDVMDNYGFWGVVGEIIGFLVVCAVAMSFGFPMNNLYEIRMMSRFSVTKS